jgi:flagellar biogenesis protein FliO
MTPLTSYVIETLITLLGVVALAVLVLYGARRVGIGRPSGPLDLVGRLPLDGRRAIYLVRVSETVYVVGASEAGLAKLGELSSDALGELATAEAPSAAFKQVLRRVLSSDAPKREAEPGPATAESPVAAAPEK